MITRDQLIVYILEASAIAIVGKIILGRSPLDTSIFILIATLAAANIIVDLYAPQLSTSLRQGTGFSLGLQQVGGSLKIDEIVAKQVENNAKSMQMLENQLQGLRDKLADAQSKANTPLDSIMHETTRKMYPDIIEKQVVAIENTRKTFADQVVKLRSQLELELRYKSRANQALEEDNNVEELNIVKDINAVEETSVSPNDVDEPKQETIGLPGKTYLAAQQIYDMTNTGEDLDDEDIEMINDSAKDIIKNVSSRIDTKGVCNSRLNEICATYGQNSDRCRSATTLLPYMINQKYDNIPGSNFNCESPLWIGTRDGVVQIKDQNN